MNDTVYLPSPGDCQPAPSPTEGLDSGVPEAGATNGSPGKLGQVSKWLRWMGAGLVVAAAATFMLRQWSQGNDETRYLLLLALTTVLGVAGMVCAHGIRDNRGGRTLLGLVIATIPVHFTVLGALLQSRFVWDGVVSAGAPWHAAGSGWAMLLSGVGIGVLFPLCWISMMVMARQHARLLAVTFFVANAPILLPVRDPDIVAVVVGGMSVLLLLIERHLSSLGYAMHTMEGRFVRAMMAIPLGIVVGRAVIWYPMTAFFAGSVLLACAALLFSTAPRLFTGEALVRTVQGISALFGVSGWFTVAGAIAGHVVIPAQIWPLFVAVPAAIILVTISATCVGSGAGYRSLAGFICAGTAVGNVVYYWNSNDVSIAGLACLVIGIATVAASIYAERKLLLLFGGVATAAGLAQTMIAAVEIEHLGHWGALATIGIGLVFASAFVERYAERLIHRVTAVGRRLESWAY